ncbi:MAG TPA: hypothetical protein VF337_04305 [Candidatus Limnocylindrales bacterium]
MPSDTDLDKTRRFAAGEIKRLLAIADPTADRLFVKARAVLGQDRTNRCLDLAKIAPLSRRYVPTSALAALVLGTGELGVEWWGRPHEELTEAGLWASMGSPDALLAAGRGDLEIEDGGSCLAELANWIADDAADTLWGRPIDYVDIGDPGVDGRLVLPDDASVGDRLIANAGAGIRVWADVVEYQGMAAQGMALLGTRLAEKQYHDVAMVRSSWSIAFGVGPIRLPGETVGRPSDPFSDHLDHDSSRRLYTWALANGASKADLAGPWRTKDALWSARFRLGLPYSRPGDWYLFDEAVAAAIDDDREALAEALATLER